MYTENMFETWLLKGPFGIVLGIYYISAKNATGASNINIFVSASGKPVQQERNTFQSRMELNAFSSHLFFTFL